MIVFSPHKLFIANKFIFHSAHLQQQSAYNTKCRSYTSRRKHFSKHFKEILSIFGSLKLLETTIRWNMHVKAGVQEYEKKNLRHGLTQRFSMCCWRRSWKFAPIKRIMLYSYAAHMIYLFVSPIVLAWKLLY